MKPISSIDLTVVIPIYNEEANLPLLYRRLRDVLREMALSYELLFVNDGSLDNSGEAIRQIAKADPCVRFVDLSRNFGHQIALMAGLDHAAGNAIVIIDADLQDPPELIPELYKKYKEGFEVVYARRRSRKGEGFLKKWTARLFYRMLARITSIQIPLDAGDFRIIDRKVALTLRQMPEQEKFIRGQIAWIGFRQTFIEYDRDSRHAGTSGYSVGKMIRFALDGITSFSDLPLRLATYLGFIVSAFAFGVMIYALISLYIWENAIRGWTSTILSVMFIGGIQLICLGIIGEYLKRIAHNVRNRPLYVVRDSNVEQDEN
jgi:dolichol-phosphate mannosyltransferase